MARSDLRRRGAANLLCRTDVGGEDGAVEARGYKLQVAGCGLFPLNVVTKRVPTRID